MIKTLTIQLTGRKFTGLELRAMEIEGNTKSYREALQKRQADDESELNKHLTDGWQIIATNTLDTSEGVFTVFHMFKADGQQPSPTVTVHTCKSVERYISRSGNVTWKLFTGNETGKIIYLRQSHKDMIPVDMWDWLNQMTDGDTRSCEIEVHTVPDGDFMKPVEVRPHVLHSSVKSIYDVLKSENYLILDTETTGLGNDAQICQIAIINAQGETLLNTLVKPTVAIPPSASNIHGITDDKVQDAPSWADIASQVETILRGQDVVIYNANYDLGVLVQTARAHELKFNLNFSDYCAMEAFAEVYGEWNDYHGNYRWQSLSTAANYYLADTSDAHDALADCLMTLAVCNGMLKDWQANNG